MDLQERLSKLRTLAFQKIADSAKKGATNEVNKLGLIPKECERLMEMVRSIESQTATIESDLAQATTRQRGGRVASTNGQTTNSDYDHGNGSPRHKAKTIRMKYVNDLTEKSGIRLQRKTEVVYETASGKKVALPYATELTNLPDRWWLGLPDEHFDFVVLLCETNSGQLLDFVFPSHFVEEIWRLLSRDHKSHVKFNIFRGGSDYELRLRDGGAQKIRRFLGGTKILS